MTYVERIPQVLCLHGVATAFQTRNRGNKTRRRCMLH
jgi:hypothetical protein